MIDFDLARSMLCSWVWQIVPRIGKAKFEADEFVQIRKQSEFRLRFLFLRNIEAFKLAYAIKLLVSNSNNCSIQ